MGDVCGAASIAQNGGGVHQIDVVRKLRSGRLVALNADTLPIRRQWYLLHRTDLDLSPTLRSVFGFISDQKGAFLPKL